MDIDGRELTPEREDIALEHVDFSYDSKPILRDVSLTIPEKTTAAIVGPSGSGKSTITRLIASLWDVKESVVRLGSVDIRTLPLSECTKRIAYVSQDNYLFDLSVMDNIRLADRGPATRRSSPPPRPAAVMRSL